MGRRAGWILCALVACVLATESDAAAQVDQTCELSLTKFDPAIVNVAYPDQAATYYSGAYQAAPGTRIRIDGRYAHARYMSFNVYDVAQRPLDALADVQIAADAGSTNPFITGANRRATKRDYTAFIDFGPIPSKRARNTLYTGSGQGGTPNFTGTFIYRVYVPDKGLDELGGTGVPTVTLETTSGGKPTPSACNNFSRPSASGVNETVAAQNGLPVAAPAPGTDPPHWRKFINLPRSFTETVLDKPYGDPARRSYESSPLYDLGGSGGFLSNIHNAYLYAPIAKDNGLVLVTRMKVATFPNTRPAPARMPGGQLRYFSLCQNETQTQRFIACATDDQTTLTPGRYANYVLSTPGERPANARPACGFTWLPWGPQAGGVLIYRNMLPDPAFAQAIQRVPEQGKEKQVMGAYFPASKYYADRAAFEKLGCSRVSSPVAKAACRDRKPAHSTISRRSVSGASHHRRPVFKGHTIDFGCRGNAKLRSRAGHVKLVQVPIWREAGGRCEFLKARGALTGARRCSKRIWLTAKLHRRRGHTKVSWTFRPKKPLPSGRYRLRIRGTDSAGNRERSHRFRGQDRFVVS